MENNLNIILVEIEEIIARIGNYDIGKAQFSKQGRKELTDLFRTKIQLAISMNKKSQLKLVG